MRRSILLAAAAAVLRAQAVVPADTVLAKVDGKPVTAGELRNIITAAPGFLAAYKAKPDEAIRDYFVLRALAEKGDQLKLADQSPWKEQIENARINILANATLSHEVNAYPVPEEQVLKYYEANQGRFEQATVKIIKIGFNTSTQAKGTSDDALKEAAQGVIAAAHNPNRSEADAKKLADDLVRQARGGADFAKLAAQIFGRRRVQKSRGRFRRDQDEQFVSGGFEAHRAGAGSAPGQRPGEDFDLRVLHRSLREEIHAAVEEVHAAVQVEIRQKHTDEFLKELQKRYTPVIEKPDALIQIGNGK